MRALKPKKEKKICMCARTKPNDGENRACVHHSNKPGNNGGKIVYASSAQNLRTVGKGSKLNSIFLIYLLLISTSMFANP